MENFNKINLKKEFLKMYVKEATPEQLEQINMLLEQGNYQQINAIIDEYTNNIINNKDLKNFGSGNPSGGGVPERPGYKEEFNTEDMEPQTFELYCILMLIDEYEKEQDKTKKELLHSEIQMAISRYRNHEELTPGRAK